MYKKEGILVKGPPPANVGRQKGSSTKRRQEIVKHRPFVSRNRTQAGNIDELLKSGGKGVRICLQRTLGGLGDIIMTTPIARGAKRKYPNCHVTYSVDTKAYNGAYADVLLYNPYIDEIIDYTIARKDDYHIFSDVTRSGLEYELPYTIFPNRIDLFARSAKIPLFGQALPILVLTETEETFGKTFVQNAIHKKDPTALVAVQIRSNDPKRTWPKENLLAFLNLAYKEGLHVFLFGWGDSSTEWNLPGVTQVFEHPVRHAAAILKQCDVLVCPDSSMLHIGGALNMKMVSLFGSMPPASRINHYKNAIAVINQKIPCIGCVYSACNNRYYCMTSISPQSVIKAVYKKLSDSYIEVSSTEAYPTVSTSFEDEALIKKIGTVEL